MKIEEFKSEELKEQIRTMLDKMPSDEIAEEELEKITALQIRYKYANGAPTDVSLDEIIKLNNIETLAIGGTEFTDSDYETLKSMKKLSKVQFFDFTFQSNAKTKRKLAEKVKSLRIINSRNVEALDYSEIEDLGMMGCTVDFSKLNLGKVKRLVLASCKITNMTDLLELADLEFVLLDGSTITDVNGKKMRNIERKPNVDYSFEEDAKVLER